ncbi:Amt family ammonium transporter [Motilibacter rhizosphaerae]|uniref:Ammonium transporter n=1 Tax=Motilibacter rhizosphaerae TaxID=598652 RepID=A0A4Q7NUH7_9ACTN|nr:ammonium transporter [Motilibacter rhizosphaerae]RZS90817.1 Amt family ammonium transporter [Motilibacter rhizosphaerae]
MAAVSAADTAWVLVCAALVLFMAPGLALFYGGMVRSKHVLAIMAQVFGAAAVVSLLWALVGHSLAFGPDHGRLLGDLHLAGLGHAGDAIPGFPHLAAAPQAFTVFQMMFAVITAALLAGAGADRMHFGSFLLFVGAWVLLVYAPLAHWVFSPNGWLAHLGVLDFAGGTVVETNSGASALALCLVLGARRGWPREQMAPHSLPLTLVGAGILWFGWIGFNAGSALAVGGLAAQAALSTHLAGCAGLLGWLLVEKLQTRHSTTLGAASGAVAGLVAITPAAGYVNALGAIVIGFLGGVVSVFAVEQKVHRGYDDSLDVVGVHGVAGVVGTLLVGVFATRTVNAGVPHTGLLDGGGMHLLGLQALAVVVTVAWAFPLTYAIAALVQRTARLRVPHDAELEGLDTYIHAESAYDIGSRRVAGRMGA